MGTCGKCGNSKCGGNCEDKCIKVYKPSSFTGGQTGIPGADGNEGVGIINIIDNGDNTFTIFLSDGSDYTINLPPYTGKHVVQINPVSGNDNQWELVYDDSSTAIISSPYYLVQEGSGEALIYNESGHPTKIRSLDESGSNSKMHITTSGNRVLFAAKQYGKSTDLSFSDYTELNSYITLQAPKYELSGGSTTFVSKSGGGSPISNHITKEYDINVMPIDAYHAMIYFRIVHEFDLTYNKASYDNAFYKMFHFNFAFNLPQNIGSYIPLNYWDTLNVDYFHQNPTVCSYDIYDADRDTLSNKLRRYRDRKFCDVMLKPQDATTTDPGSGWYSSNSVGNSLFFRYPYFDQLIDPAEGDIIQTLRFESIGSIYLNTKTDTDFLTGIPNIVKNH